MLVKVSVENFKSFDKAAELTMISSNKIRTNANHRLKIKSTQLLKYAVVYGANASGKTNLALFFKFFKDLRSPRHKASVRTLRSPALHGTRSVLPGNKLHTEA